MKFWDFFLSAESGESFPKVLLLMLIGLAVALLLTFLEHRLRAKWVFLSLHAVLITAVAFLFMTLGSGLSEMIVFLLLYLLIRLIFVCFEGRDKT
jgi:hypothetical protein